MITSPTNPATKIVKKRIETVNVICVAVLLIHLPTYIAESAQLLEAESEP